MTHETSRSWYVIASFGAEWGPMSFDTLREMADKGDVSHGDLARCGIDGEWQSVMTVLEQSPTSEFTTDFEPEAATAMPEDQETQSLPIEESSAAEVEPEIKPPRQPVQRRPGALPNWSSYWSPDSAVTREPVAVPRFVPEPKERFSHAAAIDTEAAPKLSNATIASTDQQLEANDETDGDRIPTNGSFAELEAWKHERSKRLDRLLKIVAERESAAAEAAREAEAERAGSATDSTDSDSPAADIEHSQPSEPNRAATVMTSKRRAAAQQESWEQTLERWKRSLPDPKVALVLLLLPLAAWWWWPSSDTAIADSYQSMYFELLELRERPNDKTGMEDFLARSQAELDRVIPGLKRRASPAKPELQWLLWMGQDCLRPMLKQPRQADTKSEVTFNKLMREWKRRHDPKLEESEGISASVKETDSSHRVPASEPSSADRSSHDASGTKKDDDVDQ